MKPPFLEAKDIYLRPLLPEDADGPYISWFNDEEVCRGNAHHIYPYTHRAAQTYIEQAQAFDRQLILAIVLQKTHRHIGNAALLHIDPVSRSAEFAIVVGEKDCWGKGYSKQVGRLLLNHAFNSLNLNRVYCGTYEVNTAMRLLAAFLGMQEEGRRRQAAFKNNRYVDIIEFGVLREEYMAKLGSPKEEIE